MPVEPYGFIYDRDDTNPQEVITIVISPLLPPTPPTHPPTHPHIHTSFYPIITLSSSPPLPSFFRALLIFSHPLPHPSGHSSLQTRVQVVLARTIVLHQVTFISLHIHPYIIYYPMYALIRVLPHIIYYPLHASRTRPYYRSTPGNSPHIVLPVEVHSTHSISSNITHSIVKIHPPYVICYPLHILTNFYLYVVIPSLRCHCTYPSDRFADIPIPPSEDWEAATGEVLLLLLPTPLILSLSITLPLPLPLTYFHLYYHHTGFPRHLQLQLPPLPFPSSIVALSSITSLTYHHLYILSHLGFPWHLQLRRQRRGATSLPPS